MIEIVDINKTYNSNVKILEQICLNFKKGEFVSILGKNGSGKSTLLNILGGLDEIYEGNYYIYGKNFKNYTSEGKNLLRRQKIGLIFQNFNLLPNLTVFENVEIALVINDIKFNERKQKINDVLIKVGLSDCINKKVYDLSGGEQQRVAIARALINNPEIILADEPTGQLDSNTAIEIMDLIHDLSKDKLVIMVTHSEELASKYSTRLIRINDGKVESDSIIKQSLPNTNENNLLIKTSFSNKQIFRISLRNVFLRKRLLMMTLFILIISITTFIIVTSIGIGLKKETSKILSQNYDLSKIIFSYKMPENEIVEPTLFSEYIQELNKNDLVKNIYPSTVVIPLISYDKNKNIKEQAIINYEITTLLLNDQSSFNFITGEMPQLNNQILIDKKTAKYLVYEYYHNHGLETKKVMTFSNEQVFEILKDKEISLLLNFDELQLYPIEVFVSGIIEDNIVTSYRNYLSNIDNEIVHPVIFVTQDIFYEIYNQYMGHPSNTDIMEYYRPYNIIIEIEEENFQTRQNAIKKIINESPLIYYPVIIDEYYENINNLSLYLISIGIIFGGLIFISSSLIVWGIISNSLNQRKKEIGVFYTLGYSKEIMKKILFVEGWIISIIGIMLSFLISLVVKYYINVPLCELIFNLLNINNKTSVNIIQLKWYLFVVVIILLPLLFIKPIRKFSKLSITDVLREE